MLRMFLYVRCVAKHYSLELRMLCYVLGMCRITGISRPLIYVLLRLYEWAMFNAINTYPQYPCFLANLTLLTWFDTYGLIVSGGNQWTTPMFLSRSFPQSSTITTTYTVLMRSMATFVRSRWNARNALQPLRVPIRLDIVALDSLA